MLLADAPFGVFQKASAYQATLDGSVLRKNGVQLVDDPMAVTDHVLPRVAEDGPTDPRATRWASERG